MAKTVLTLVLCLGWIMPAAISAVLFLDRPPVNEPFTYPITHPANWSVTGGAEVMAGIAAVWLIVGGGYARWHFIRQRRF